MTRVRFATSALSRLRGLLFRAPSASVDDELLALAPCASIHTFGMRQAIDVAFADARGVVLKSCTGVEPGRLLRCPGAAITLERFAPERRTLDKAWFAKGDSLCLDALASSGKEGFT